MSRTHKITLTAMMISMSVVINQILELIPFLQLTDGGTFFSFTMLPIIFTALMLGPLWGIFAGVTYGLLSFILARSSSAGIISIIFDYVLASSVVGLIGFMKRQFKSGKTWLIVAGIFGCFVLRCLSKTCSSVLAYNVSFIEGIIYNGPVDLSAVGMVITLFILTSKRVRKYALSNSMI
ncbi:MAG: energy-coupled thiamine transporter ThiT [Erysipelotrichales bacterium]|nr:energy-coupled thiamine transporter ThiT [Erysipelotrichales bacterium]